MTSKVDALARQLAAACRSAAAGEKVVQIHLFGIRNAEALIGVSLPELLVRAGLDESYKTEIRKGIKLAPYVRPAD